MANEPLSKLKKLQADAQDLLQDKPELAPDETQLPVRRKLAHFAVRVYLSFVRNRCPIRAAALAYTTVLAFVPLLAVVLSISTGLLKKESASLYDWIDKAVRTAAPQVGLEVKAGGEGEKTLAEVREKIESFIQNFQSGKIGVTGIVAFIFVAISLLSTIEATFNDIWGVSRGRPWFSRVVLYWAALTLGPIFLSAAFGLNTASQIKNVPAWLGILKSSGVVWMIERVGPYVILSVILAMLYFLMPNTRVQFRAALVGGCVGGILFQINGYFNVAYVSRVVTYRQVYGGLAAIPLFLLGLYFSWIIVLLGAQVTYAFQNRKAYVLERQASHVNQRGRELIAMRLMTCIGQRFHQGAKAPTALELTNEIGVSSRLISQVLEGLLQSQLLVEVVGEETAYAPGRPLERISAHDVLVALRVGTGRELAMTDNPTGQLVSREFESIAQAERGAASLITLEDLVNRTKSRPMGG